LDDPNDDATGRLSQRCKETEKLEELTWQKTRRGQKAIMTLTGKENFLGDEILHIKHRSVKFKINMIITIEFLNR
jgi:hypothetical protein